ncbi:tripartite tricarboxylate transporter TctB family protein [Rubrimonas cliftonensis]|uniref:Putative tricarboxylic transport membrane protein n=1 Tax=Rubrimonas cliftonensis TaxID=89524 RepID=A0A1H3XIQ0_9RHOB|nr:tripartite tricarboxylate transporter TctB family protein [Rubrimonas cliftonensis]SDZ99277.1 putative tricarboxylic transport membrane protein [Rubrimonas cliftonensis]
MNRGDAWTGAALVALGLAVVWRAQGFPKLGGMDYGPDLFPTIAAGGLIVCGGLIGAEGARAPAASRGDSVPAKAVGLLATVAGAALALPWLGFHLTFAAVALVASRLFGGGWATCAAMAAAAPLALHFIFYSLLRVPLPWGLLTPAAW